MLERKQIAHDIAEDVLSYYRDYKKAARVKFPTLGSPVSDGMPSGSTIGNSQENKYVKYMDNPYKLFCEYCDELIDTIEREDNQEYAKALRLKFIVEPRPTIVKSSKVMNISRTTFYRLLENALIDFGESLSYPQINAYYVEMDNMMLESKRKNKEISARAKKAKDVTHALHYRYF